MRTKRAEAERKLAELRAQDEALQAYLDQMNTLLLEHNLRNSNEDSGVRTLARARTLTVLERLDHPSRKTAVMQFLTEAELVQRVEGGRVPIITLATANLRDANLRWADLRYASLNEANLSEALLFDADLREADLIYADLSNADLRYADLNEANLSKANLRDADLSEAILFDAFLFDADMREADLIYADLSGADLSGADLRDAKGITIEELDQQASSLEGATMPNGQKYEDWRKSRGQGDSGS